MNKKMIAGELIKLAKVLIGEGAPVGKAQEFIYEAVKQSSKPTQLTDIAARKGAFTIGFKALMKAAYVLQKKGLVKLESKQGEGIILSMP